MKPSNLHVIKTDEKDRHHLSSAYMKPIYKYPWNESHQFNAVHVWCAFVFVLQKSHFECYVTSHKTKKVDWILEPTGPNDEFELLTIIMNMRMPNTHRNRLNINIHIHIQWWCVTWHNNTSNFIGYTIKNTPTNAFAFATHRFVTFSWFQHTLIPNGIIRNFEFLKILSERRTNNHQNCYNT